jgi:hypothetical protein
VDVDDDELVVVRQVDLVTGPDLGRNLIDDFASLHVAVVADRDVDRKLATEQLVITPSLRRGGISCNCPCGRSDSSHGLDAETGMVQL